jgi:hypothetical protein
MDLKINGDYFIIEQYICCGIKINLSKSRITRISRGPSALQFTIYQKPVENIEYFKYLGSMTNDARCIR